MSQPTWLPVRNEPPPQRFILVPDLEYLLYRHLDLFPLLTSREEDVGYELGYIPSVLSCLDVLKKRTRPDTHAGFFMCRALAGGQGTRAMRGWFAREADPPLVLTEADLNEMMHPTTRHSTRAVALARALADDMLRAIETTMDPSITYVSVVCLNDEVRARFAFQLWSKPRQDMERIVVIDNAFAFGPAFYPELCAQLCSHNWDARHSVPKVTHVYLRPTDLNTSQQPMHPGPVHVIPDTNMIQGTDLYVLDGISHPLEDVLELDMVLLNTVVAEAKRGPRANGRIALIERSDFKTWPLPGHPAARGISCDKNGNPARVQPQGDSAILYECASFLAQAEGRTVFITADLTMALRMLVLVSACPGDNHVMMMRGQAAQMRAVFHHPKFTLGSRFLLDWSNPDMLWQHMTSARKMWIEAIRGLAPA